MAVRLDAISAMRFYIDKVVTDSTIGGMKALLLDQQTTKFVSMVYSQTQILDQEVYLVADLNKARDSMGHLKAAVFVQPTEDNLALLLKELSDPKYAEYHLFFSNIVPQDILSRLAAADEHDLIRQVQEYYGDFAAVNEELFHLSLTKSLFLASPTHARTLAAATLSDRNLNGVLSMLLATKRKPSQIRYQAASQTAQRLASDVVLKLSTDDIFEFRTPGPVLLILDRRDDPITPLLTQWTYQAMVHELLGLNNNRVDLAGRPGIKKELEQVVLSCTQDEFFARHRFANFGDLGAAIKEMLDAYSKESKLNENIASIEDMQNFMTRYPQFRSKSINVSKHVALMTELARLVDVYRLLDISQLEQEIACANDHGTHKRQLMDKMANPSIEPKDKLRLCLLFVLKYESYDETRELKTRLIECGLGAEDASLLDLIIEYAGEARRAQGLFTGGASATNTVTGFMSRVSKTIATNLNGVENVYTQHVPLLMSTLDALAKGKLKDAQFPLVSASSGAGAGAGGGAGGGAGRVSEVIVFMVGGATYEEATKVAEFNAGNNGMRVLLGGSCIHNSNSFLKEIKLAFGR